MYCWCAANSLAICSLSAAAKDFWAIRAPGRSGSPRRSYRTRSPDALLFAPAKARLERRRVERAVRQTVRHARVVVAGGGDVVGRLGVEERREILDVTASDALLALSAPVD